MEKILKIETILSVLRWVFAILLLFVLLVIIIQINNLICNCSPISFCELALNWHFLKYLLIACFSLLTLYVAGGQLEKQTDIACITALSELRKQLTSERNRNVHFVLSLENEQNSPKDEQKTMEDKIIDDETKNENKLMDTKKIHSIDIFNYLGTLELGVLMVKRNLIDMDTFYSQFGYRIENIFEEGNSGIHISVREHINANRSYYENILWGYEKIRKKFFK